MEEYIQISKINDFIFCPVSLYLHSIYENFSDKIFHSSYQVVGKINHKAIDEKKYSTSKRFIVGMEIYSDKYNLAGKIDIYDKEKEILIERKTRIKQIFDGYRYQLYAQYFCFLEMGYSVKKMKLHSLEDNKNYKVNIPSEKEKEDFEKIIKKINNFNLNDLLNHSCPNCKNNIYSNLSW